eukprot:9491359-Pyramimonas_sp.AAC.1
MRGGAFRSLRLRRHLNDGDVKGNGYLRRFALPQAVRELSLSRRLISDSGLSSAGSEDEGDARAGGEVAYKTFAALVNACEKEGWTIDVQVATQVSVNLAYTTTHHLAKMSFGEPQLRVGYGLAGGSRVAPGHVPAGEAATGLGRGHLSAQATRQGGAHAASRFSGQSKGLLTLRVFFEGPPVRVVTRDTPHGHAPMSPVFINGAFRPPPSEALKRNKLFFPRCRWRAP